MCRGINQKFADKEMMFTRLRCSEEMFFRKLKQGPLGSDFYIWFIIELPAS